MAAFHVWTSADDTVAHPAVQKITLADLGAVLRQGFADFLEKPSHLIFLCLIYPVVGVLLALWTTGNNALPLLYPLMSGFALIGPFAALGLYEISRRRERGLHSTWRDALGVLRSPAIPAILTVGVMLFVIFYAWLATAETLYQALFGLAAPASLSELMMQMFSTPQGWTLIIAGNLLGLCFALVTLATTVIAFPLLVDRDVGAMAAIATSFRAFLRNPVPLLAWGVIVAVLLVLGSIPFFVGLAIVIPVLGHATWHLYRKLLPIETL